MAALVPRKLCLELLIRPGGGGGPDSGGWSWSHRGGSRDAQGKAATVQRDDVLSSLCLAVKERPHVAANRTTFPAAPEEEGSEETSPPWSVSQEAHPVHL